MPSNFWSLILNCLETVRVSVSSPSVELSSPDPSPSDEGSPLLLRRSRLLSLSRRRSSSISELSLLSSGRDSRCRAFTGLADFDRVLHLSLLRVSELSLTRLYESSLGFRVRRLHERGRHSTRTDLSLFKRQDSFWGKCIYIQLYTVGHCSQSSDG